MQTFPLKVFEGLPVLWLCTRVPMWGVRTMLQTKNQRAFTIKREQLEESESRHQVCRNSRTVDPEFDQTQLESGL